jgi:hypothetical protein
MLLIGGSNSARMFFQDVLPHTDAKGRNRKNALQMDARPYVWKGGTEHWLRISKGDRGSECCEGGREH